MTNQADKAPLILAVPSKGRLQENANAFFARAGLVFKQSRGERDYRGTIAGFDNVEVLYLSASEIARELAQGGAHLGITGEDLIREGIDDAAAKLELLTPLGFGHANVVVAVPQAWIDVRNMADLEDVAAAFRARHGHKMRVATKYINLTRRFFTRHGITDYRIVESLGATEGAPASGAAELIVDITTTGATLSANALKIIDDGVMLRSEANLVASMTAPWGANQRAAAASILTRICAEEEARSHREIRVSLSAPVPSVVDELSSRFAASLVATSDASNFIVQCPVGALFDASEYLVAQGAIRVAVSQIDYVFRPTNALLETLYARIGSSGTDRV
jgi:ATP phosphoribosyltransferase